MTHFTSKAIEESFIRLLNGRPLDKITIKDIVDDCGISRNTFYYHFQDITALLQHILNADVERVEHTVHKKVFPEDQKWWWTSINLHWSA